MILLLDLGNTRLKWALADADGHRPAVALAWNGNDVATTLAGAWKSLPPPARVLGACVAASGRRALVERALSDAGWPAPTWLVSPARMDGLVNAYGHPEQLGIDRFLMLLAAWHAGLAPCVVAGCGSALTLDVLDAGGQHRGGLIVAGVAAMHRALVQAAPGLPPDTGTQIVDIAVETTAAIHSGAWQAVAGAIERFVSRQRIALGGALRLLLAGGDAEVIASLLEAPSVVVPDAVLAGLAAWDACAGQEVVAG